MLIEELNYLNRTGKFQDSADVNTHNKYEMVPVIT